MSRPAETLPAAPPDERGTRERTLFVRALIARATRVRLRLTAICLTMGLLDAALDVVPGPWQLLVGGSLIELLANELLSRLNRRGAADERHLWAMQVLDSILMAILVLSLGTLGYLAAPFAIFAATSYAMGHQRAARSQYWMSLLIYPAARIAGERVLAGGVSPWPIVLETLCLAVIGWMSMQGPVRYTRRVRRARQALGALERGDFSVRLPTRALDDVGFLGISFNATAGALGTAIRTLEDEVEERARAEESMRSARLEATRIAERMAAVAEAAGGVLAATSVETLQDVLREASAHVLDSHELSLMPYDEKHGTLRLSAPDDADPGTIPLLSSADLGRLLSQRRTLITSRDGGCDETADAQANAGCLGTLMRTPVLAGLDVLAVLSVRTPVANAYTGADIAVFEALAALAATAMRNMHLVDELRASQEALFHQAHHDGLTGLPNRRRFRERVVQALSESAPEQVAILALDLDGFKEVNDSLGHAAGDRVLQHVAERLLNATRGSDLVARLGGDEFAIVLSHVPDEAHAVVVANRLLQSIQSPFLVADRVVTLGTCIGIAFGAPLHAAPAQGDSVERREATSAGLDWDAVDTLLHEADVALYRAKTAGKSCWAIFETSMHNEELSRRQLEADLRVAVSNDAIELRFQPIHELAGGTLRGVEAQLRWEDPERGVVAPALWMALADETGLMTSLRNRALLQSCRALSAWQELHHRHCPSSAPLTLAIQVSVRQLERPEFVDEVRTVLATTGVAARSLVLEVAESALLRASDLAREQLHLLRGLGVRVALDEFGGGTSSLGQLQGLPVDILKIDRAFTRGVSRGGSQTALTRTLLALGEALVLETMATGVDHEQQRASLQALGCGLGQGSQFASAMPADAITRLLEATPEAVLA